MKEPTQVPERRFCSTHSRLCMQCAQVKARPCTCASACISAAVWAPDVVPIELWALGILLTPAQALSKGYAAAKTFRSGLFLKVSWSIGQNRPAKELATSQFLGRFYPSVALLDSSPTADQPEEPQDQQDHRDGKEHSVPPRR